MRLTLISTALSVLAVCGCASGTASTVPDADPAPTPETEPERSAEAPALPERVVVAEGLVALRNERAVEIEGFVPIDAQNADTPDVFLETVLCAVDSKEHESLVATAVRPSDIHAALLLVGLEPGAPGSWSFDGGRMVSSAPAGASVEVSILVGGERFTPEQWIVGIEGERFESRGYVFAGSYFKRTPRGERYEADADGVIVGLHTFGSEVVAEGRVMSHDSGVAEPEWIAKSTMPAYGTEVTVRIEAGGE